MTDTTADAASTATGTSEPASSATTSAIEPLAAALGGARAVPHGPRRAAQPLLPADDVPYPSGDIHIGHWYIKTPTDALARFRRMHGKNVFLPIGFDAFGLPAENAAIRNRINPRDWTMSNIANMRRQLRQMGATFDWSAEVVTCDPTTTAGTSGSSCSS